MIEGPEYDKLIGIIVENAKSLLDTNPNLNPRDDEDRFHNLLFGNVLTEIDEFHEDLSKHPAHDISDVCSEVENDIIHGDILGL